MVFAPLSLRTSTICSRDTAGVEVERTSWWGPVLAIGPLVVPCAAFTGGLALYRIADRANFNAREVVGQAGASYITASGLRFSAPHASWPELWSWSLGLYCARRQEARGARRNLTTWLSVTLVAVTVARCLLLWLSTGDAPLARIALDTQVNFCGRVVLATTESLYVEVETRRANETSATPSATTIPSSRLVAVSNPPKTDCRNGISIDKLGGR